MKQLVNLLDTILNTSRPTTCYSSSLVVGVHVHVFILAPYRDPGFFLAGQILQWFGLLLLLLLL